MGTGTLMNPKPSNSPSNPSTDVASATPYISRRAGDSRIVNARKKPWAYLTARLYQGRPSSSAVLMPLAKK
jgi:hypothetical protein